MDSGTAAELPVTCPVPSFYLATDTVTLYMCNLGILVPVAQGQTGSNFFGPPISSFDANIQDQAFAQASGQFGVSGQNLNPSTTSGVSGGVQGIAQGFSALAFWGLASNTVNTEIDFPNAGDFQAFLSCTGNCGGGPIGSAADGLGAPALGTTMSTATGFRGAGVNEGPGAITTVAGFAATANQNTASGTVTQGFGYDNQSPQIVGTTNAAYHTVNQGTGANNYAFYSEGGRVRFDNTPVPASAAAAGTQGQIAWDSSFIYVCISANTWKRSAISTW